MTDSKAEPTQPERHDVWADVRGTSVHGTYSVNGGWVEVTADDGQYKTAAVGESSPHEVAERLLGDLYRRDSGAVGE